MIYLKPVLPEMAAQAEKMLNAGEFSWSSVNMPLRIYIKPFQRLANRIDPKAIEAMVEASAN